MLAEAGTLTQQLGFETVDARVVIDRFRAEPELVWVSNAPAASLDLTQGSDAMRRDPGVAALQADRRADIWNQDTCGTVDGKTAWGLGNILGISEQTAARHLNNATQKLGCVNKLHAVKARFPGAHR